jgi:5-methylcytosine-specific restriction protein A
MPSALQRQCSGHGGRCPNTVVRGLCAECQQHTRKVSASYHSWYSDRRWRAARAIFLARHPLCLQCKAEGRSTPATVVDHEPPHRGDRRAFWDQATWRQLCKPHHDAKTARETAFAERGRG